MLARASSPFGDAVVVRALAPDVAFVHAERVDAWGNATLGAPAGDALVAAQAARRVVVVAEGRVEALAPAAKGAEAPPAIDLPGVLVDAVVVAPGAAAPDGVAGHYARDVEAYAAYARASRTDAGFAAWLAAVT
jgi:glutaconate CoA-transferase subunit A